MKTSPVSDSPEDGASTHAPPSSVRVTAGSSRTAARASGSAAITPMFAHRRNPTTAMTISAPIDPSTHARMRRPRLFFGAAGGVSAVEGSVTPPDYASSAWRAATMASTRAKSGWPGSRPVTEDVTDAASCSRRIRWRSTDWASSGSSKASAAPIAATRASTGRPRSAASAAGPTKRS